MIPKSPGHIVSGKILRPDGTLFIVSGFTVGRFDVLSEKTLAPLGNRVTLELNDA